MHATINFAALLEISILQQVQQTTEDESIKIQFSFSKHILVSAYNRAQAATAK